MLFFILHNKKNAIEQERLVEHNNENNDIRKERIFFLKPSLQKIA